MFMPNIHQKVNDETKFSHIPQFQGYIDANLIIFYPKTHGFCRNRMKNNSG